MALSATRVSPGVYTVNGKQIRSTTSAGALAAYTKQYGSGTTTPTKTTTPGAPTGPANSNPGVISNSANLDTSNQLINAQANINGKLAAQDNTAMNGNTVGPGGTQTNAVDPNTGQITTINTLSDANTKDLAGVQNSGIAAGNANTNLIGNAFGALSGDPSSYKMNPYQQAIYGQLTQNVDKQKQQETDQLQQQLQNRGVPIGSDEYKKEMGNMFDKYQSTYQNANNSAVSQGAGLANQAIQTLSNVAQTGFYDPKFGAATGVNLANAGLNPNVQQDVNTVGQLGIGRANAANGAVSAQAAMKGAGAAVTNAGTQQAIATLAAQNQQNQNPHSTDVPPGAK